MVSVLHHTAREFLTQATGSGLFVDSYAGHGSLFLRTLEVLDDPELRWRLTRNDNSRRVNSPFLFYAAASWPFHLKKCGESPAVYLDAMVHFLRSSAVLSWINLLAVINSLEILVKASKVLAKFVVDMKKNDALKNPMLHRLADLEILESWSLDFLKIVGKFGGYLLSDPATIYDAVPALSPRASAIHGQFHLQGTAGITVHGMDQSEWTDHLGRLSLPFDSEAWQLVAGGKSVATLASSNAVHVWNSTNFSERTRVSDGEPIITTALNSTGTRLVTYGMRLTKLWSIPEGSLLMTVSNPIQSKPMSMMFHDNDKTILSGGDDNVIRRLQMNSFELGWQILNEDLLKDGNSASGAVAASPMWLEFTADGKFVGVAYRGAPLAIWRLDDGCCLNRCMRSTNVKSAARKSSTNWFAVDRFTWNPVTLHVIGIYKVGTLFKWHPMTDELIESNRTADEVAASPTGKLFATSSSDGCVRIWNFSYFTVIYQLSSEDLVTGLCFSPDSRRFYDMRGGVINAWEPNCLTRLAEAEEHISDTNSEVQSLNSTSKFSEARIQQFEVATALAVSPDGYSYCIGHEDGSVFVHMKDANIAEFTRFYNFLDVTHMDWSPNGGWIASVDLAGQLLVSKASKITEPDEKIPVPKPPKQVDEMRGLLLGNDGRHLLVSTDGVYKTSLFDLWNGNGTPIATAEIAPDVKWIRHPSRSDIVLALDTSGIFAYTWDTLEKICERDYRHHSPASLLHVSAGHDQKHILVCLDDCTEDAIPSRKILAIRTTELEVSEPLPSTLHPITIPPNVACHVHTPLGILSSSAFAFLDSDLWFCTYNFMAQGKRTEIHNRHYFIPRDWVGGASLPNCTVSGNGTLFWPMEDRIVRIEINFETAKSY